MVHVPFGESIFPAHVSDDVYPADAVTLLIVRLPVLLVFLTVIAWAALAAPASRLPKFRLAGVKDTLGEPEPEPEPIPLNPTG
jgi:hypothetical protein